MKLSLVTAAAFCLSVFAIAGESTKPSFAELHEQREMISEAGECPAQPAGAPIELVDKWIRFLLKDPSSVIYDEIRPIEAGHTPGGRPCLVTRVTWRAKNSYGAYEGNRIEEFYIQKGRILSSKRLL